jgi:hypothetical protein
VAYVIPRELWNGYRRDLNPSNPMIDYIWVRSPDGISDRFMTVHTLELVLRESVAFRTWTVSQYLQAQAEFREFRDFVA